MEAVTDFLFLGSKITAESDFSHEIRRPLILGRKDVTLLTKVHLVRVMVFPVVMYRCESWTMKKAECQRTDAFKLWYWRRLLRVPWKARRSNQSIFKYINLDYLWKDWCWNRSSNTLATWCKQLTQKRTWCWKRSKAEEDGWLASLIQCKWTWADSRRGKPVMLQSMGSQRVEHNLVTEQQQKVNHHWKDKRLRYQ